MNAPAALAGRAITAPAQRRQTAHTKPEEENHMNTLLFYVVAVLGAARLADMVFRLVDAIEAPPGKREAPRRPGSRRAEKTR